MPRLTLAGTPPQAKLNDLLQGEQDRLRMVDLWSYQRKEIEPAHLEPGEDEALETEKRVLANAEKLYAAAIERIRPALRRRRLRRSRSPRRHAQR